MDSHKQKQQSPERCPKCEATVGLIVAGVAHLLFVWVLYVLFRERIEQLKIEALPSDWDGVFVAHEK